MARLLFDSKQNYDCLQCGRSCRMGCDIPTEAEVVMRLAEHPMTLRVISEKGPVFREQEGQHSVLSCKESRRCHFLEGELCAIHREVGYEAKPATCKLFPFVVTETPEGMVVGTSYYCSAARQNWGGPCSSHEEDLKRQLLGPAPINRVAANGLLLHNRYYASYADYKGLEQEIQARSARGGYARALAQAALGLVRLMAQVPELEEGVVAFGHRLGEVWQLADVDSLEVLQPGTDQQIADYFKFWLERPLWDEVDAALGGRGSFSIPQLDWRGSWADLKALGVDDFDTEMERYLEHLVFRKALVIHPLMLPSLLQLVMLPDFLRVLTGLLACSRGRRPQIEDYYDALQEAEMYLVTHGRSRRLIHELTAEDLVEAARASVSRP